MVFESWYRKGFCIVASEILIPSSTRFLQRFWRVDFGGGVLYHIAGGLDFFLEDIPSAVLESRYWVIGGLNSLLENMPSAVLESWYRQGLYRIVWYRRGC